ncbi:MAG: hypothetical protein AAFP28_03645 [Pseudomonadota bacterium]
MNALRSLWIGALALVLGTPLTADPLQERLQQIPSEMTSLFDLYSDGDLNDDQLSVLMEQYMVEEMQLRTGALTADDLTLRWRDHASAPFKTPGARLSAVGLPADFDGLVWATLEDGRRVDLVVEQSAATPEVFDVYLPEHPDGADASGTITIRFLGVGSLEAELAPQLVIPGALPTLMRVVIDDLMRTLEANGTDPYALLEDFRDAPSEVPPELGYAAAVLYIWSEAGRDHPVFSFMRTGRFEGEFWERVNAPVDAQAIDRFYSSVLLNSGALEDLMRMQRGRVDRISYVPPAPPPELPSNLLRVNTTPPITEQVSMDEISALLIEGRARQYEREVYLNSAKDAQKLYGYAAFEPVTMVSSAMIGGVLTMVDKYKKGADYNYPTTMKLEGTTVPSGALLADDERRVYTDITILAKGEPLEVQVFGDGLDAALAILDLATSFSAAGKAAKDTVRNLGKAPIPRSIQDQVAASLNLAEDVIVGRATAATKDGLEAIEKSGNTSNKGSFDIYTLPARTWRARIDARSHRNFVSVGYGGEVRWDVRQFHAYACWKDTQEGITTTITTKPDVFGGLFDRLDLGWVVKTPEVELSASPSILRPGGTADVIAPAQGATSNRVQFEPPSLGALSDFGELYATYTAPDTIAGCQEVVQLIAQYPPDGARICAPAPRATAGIVIAQGDGLVRTPRTLTCRDGEVLGFTVAHAEGAPVQCVLNGPGELTMVGEEGLLDCPIKPTQPSSITCFAGEQPTQCAPVIPIQRIYPEFAVSARVTADRRYSDKLGDGGESFFDDCGVEDLTAVILDLMDSGTGEARELPLETVSNPCPAAEALTTGGGGISGGSGGGAPAPLPFQDDDTGRHVAAWPLGEGRDVSVADSHSYRHSPYDPGRGPGDRSVLVSSDIDAAVNLDGPESFTVVTSGNTKGTSIRAASEHPTPSGGSADWAVWRQIEVTTDTSVTASVSTRGPAISFVQAAPMRLESNVPIMLLRGFNQSFIPVMQVVSTSSAGVVAPSSATAEVILPGPRGDRESLTYLIYFGGHVTPAKDGDNSVTAASRTTVSFDIKPVE